MSAKHTPGPWTKGERLIGPWWHIVANHTVGGELCKQGRQAIAAVHGESQKGAKAYAEMFEANARLIAAAPDLLEELDACLGTLEACFPNAPVDSVIGKNIVNARAAIAKATGEIP